jgi:hypothetical protein
VAGWNRLTGVEVEEVGGRVESPYWVGVHEGHCCCPPEAARAVAEVEVASASRVSSSRWSLQMSWKEGNGWTASVTF